MAHNLIIYVMEDAALKMTVAQEGLALSSEAVDDSTDVLLACLPNHQNSLIPGGQKVARIFG